jgi:hypothetical protein
MEDREAQVASGKWGMGRFYYSDFLLALAPRDSHFDF